MTRDARLDPQKRRARVGGISSVTAFGMNKKSSDRRGVWICSKQSSLTPGLLGFPLFKRNSVGMSLQVSS